MLTIEVLPQNLADLRFTYSPLFETMLGFRMMVSQKTLPYSIQTWVESARQAVHDLEFPYLSALLKTRQYIPDFLTAPPRLPNPTFENEIADLAQTPAETVRKYVNLLVKSAARESNDCERLLKDRMPTSEAEIRQHYLMYPAESMQCVADELYLFWRRTLAAEWSQITSVLEGDILFRARQLAVYGVEKMFNDLDSTRLSYQPTRLQLHHWDKRGETDQHMTFGEGGLQLVPTVFPKGLMFQVAPEWSPMLWYQARGVALWKQETPPRSQSLELLLGAARAEVLQALIEPATTSELARRLHLTAGAISQHLDRLQQTGLIESNRSGKRVYYQLIERGRGLLTLFDVPLP